MEAFPAESSSLSKARSMMRSATGSGAGFFRGRPRRRFGAALLTGGANRDASGVPSGGCETVAGRRARLLLLLYGSKQSQEPELPAILQHPTRFP